MKSARHLVSRAAKAPFNVPLAGWLLSLVTFIFGALIAPIYQRTTFDGIAVQQTEDSALSYGTRGVLEFATVVKIVNGSKSAQILEAVTSDLPSRGSANLQFLGSTAFFVAPGAHTLVSQYEKPNSHTVDEDLPLLLPSESVRHLVVRLAYRPAGVSPAASGPKLPAGTENLIDEYAAELSRRGFSLQLTLNGKLRNLDLRAEGPKHSFTKE